MQRVVSKLFLSLAALLGVFHTVQDICEHVDLISVHHVCIAFNYVVVGLELICGQILVFHTM